MFFAITNHAISTDISTSAAMLENGYMVVKQQIHFVVEYKFPLERASRCSMAVFCPAMAMAITKYCIFTMLCTNTLVATQKNGNSILF